MLARCWYLTYKYKKTTFKNIALWTKQENLNIFVVWVQSFLDKEQPKHIIEYFVPDIIKDNERKRGKNKKNN